MIYAESNYIRLTDNLEVRIDTKGYTPYETIHEALTDILNAVDINDTYMISEDFESYGNFDGFIRLMNVNRSVVYYLTGNDIYNYMQNGVLVLEAQKPTDTDIDDYIERYS